MNRREMTYLSIEPGHVVAGVLSEVATIPLDQQHPALIARALACARVMDDPDCALGWPAAFGRLTALLDALHEGVDE
jgi:hypothetical protein